MLLRARHYQTGQLVDIACEQGRIASISAAGRTPADREAGWAAPAFFDLQINGCAGHNFSSPSLDVAGVRAIVQACHRHGIGALCPTVITSSFAVLHHGFSVLSRACEQDRELAEAMPAFHLEGPYISSEDGPRGAHPRQFVRPPDWEEFCRLQEAAGSRIRLVTLAPEQNGGIRFIERLRDSGVVVALGHTAASAVCIRAAIDAGARLSTHLGNGSHAMLPRHENYIWEQLAADDLWASIICDGFHLPASVVRCITRVKTPGRLILTCDASPLAGLRAGRYREWDQDLEVVPDGRITVAGTPFLAGSGVFTDACVGNMVRLAGVSLGEAVDLAGAQPRALLGLPARRLEAGMPADLVLFDWSPGKDVIVRHYQSPLTAH